MGPLPINRSMAAQTLRKILTRDFILASAGLFTLGAVYHSLTPTLPIYLSTLGAKEVEIGVLIGAFGLTSLLIRPLAGKILVRIPEKKVMVAGALFYIVTGAYLFAKPFWPILFVRLIQGIGFGCFHTASFTLIANTSDEAHRGQSLSYFILSFNFASALAPSVGMFLINRFSFTLFFLVCFGLSLSLVFVTLQLGKKEVAVLRDDAVKGGFFLSRKAFPPSVMGFSNLFIFGAISAFFPIYAISCGVSNPGLFFTTMALMLILGRAFGGRIVNFSQREKIILPCLCTSVIATAILAFSGTLPMFLLAAVLWGLGHAFLIPTLLLYALDEESSSGLAMGTFHGIADAGLCLGPVIMGVVLRLTSYPVMFLCLTLMALFNIGYFCLFLRRKQR
jgi:MFS family permease